MPMSIVLISVAGMMFTFAVFSLIVKTIRDVIVGRRSSHAGWDRDGNIATPPMFERMFEKAMQERDAHQRSLEERIEVLERLATDGHKSASLAEEIERLRDKA